ncbi:alkanesulfonate monooxygenase SsuD/methylene tetrahydromethanopterin reductase-like flavin-dependent oxidoreductase (luciferase family) [Streptomyces sp. 1114.5]|uniref:LLM class flavin-dependent oxidoreductase n=1 Tax=unclassified Streptomyces TaxID=2593676 RepID=UPI000BD239A3|nr:MULTISPECIES: LLM class flavin-dependent oxidoreductase [unclassified Streptomyces]RKT19423.1 alkanesulfonate monooxygenase SsuD/methylene tetrahydromethanopterin reductase-like flavin-dependent oxidoreductase (luciferase family) [Streptomyces sp. 1114.5]SOB85619.1 Flavin-dependent oxidoreductase, luciferase family (includes alkanesulfonate monooxygenase SsuD and methylene tetrahydromethanopterin reductase) [Streptomyces sp. 1331.2]
MSTLSEDPDLVKFVYWDNLTYAPPGSRAPEEWDPKLGAKLYESYLDHCVEAERLGYAGLSVPEHFGPSSLSPHPNVMLAALAARTTRARLVSGVNLALLHHPLHLAEQFNMIDVLSGGRLEIGLGRRGDRALFEKNVDIIDGAVNRIDHPVAPADLTPTTSAFLQEAEVAKVTVWPRPVQPQVPLWVAAETDESLATAARRGWNVFTGLNLDPAAGGMSKISVEEMVARLHRYFEVGKEHGHELSMANTAASCFTVIADTDREAAELVRDGFMSHVSAAGGFLARMAGAAPDDSPLEQLAKEGDTGVQGVFEAPADSYLRNPFALVGSVETVRAKLDALVAGGFRRFVLLCGGVGNAHELGWQSATAMARDVAPELFAKTAALAPTAE